MVCRLRQESLEAEASVLDAYQLSVLQYGKQVLQTEIAWISEQLSEERTNTGDKAVYKFTH